MNTGRTRFKKGLPSWNKGLIGVYKASKETKRKMSESHKGKKLSEKTKCKMSLSKKGLIFSEEHRKKLSESHKGKKMSLENRIKRSKDNCNFWKGGKSFELYSDDWTELLKESIRERDKYICKECGLHQDELIGRLKKLDVHHIDYNKDNCNQDNLITLCRKCHIKTNFDREKWIEYFKTIWE